MVAIRMNLSGLGTAFGVMGVVGDATRQTDLLGRFPFAVLTHQLGAIFYGSQVALPMSASKVVECHGAKRRDVSDSPPICNHRYCITCGIQDGQQWSKASLEFG